MPRIFPTVVLGELEEPFVEQLQTGIDREGVVELASVGGDICKGGFYA